MYALLLMHCSLPPQVVAEMTLEQQIGLYIGLNAQDDSVVEFQSIADFQNFVSGKHP